MFEFARINNLHRNKFIKIFKIIIFAVLLYLTYENSTSGFFLSQESRLAIFGLSFFLMLEVFFYFKIIRASPSLLLKNNNGKNIYDSFTLEALGIFISSHSSVDLVNNLLSKPEVCFLLQKADIFSRELSLTKIPKDSLASLAFEIAKSLDGKYVIPIDIFASYMVFTEDKTKLLLLL